MNKKEMSFFVSEFAPKLWDRYHYKVMFPRDNDEDRAVIVQYVNKNGDVSDVVLPYFLVFDPELIHDTRNDPLPDNYDELLAERMERELERQEEGDGVFIPIPRKKERKISLKCKKNRIKKRW